VHVADGAKNVCVRRSPCAVGGKHFFISHATSLGKASSGQSLHRTHDVAARAGAADTVKRKRTLIQEGSNAQDDLCELHRLTNEG
jgi:hypothetical protein